MATTSTTQILHLCVLPGRPSGVPGCDTLVGEQPCGCYWDHARIGDRLPRKGIARYVGDHRASGPGVVHCAGATLPVRCPDLDMALVENRHLLGKVDIHVLDHRKDRE